MNTPVPTTAPARWRKSSRSTDTGGDCVEVAAMPGVLAVRDSKDPHGPILHFTPPAFRTLVHHIRAGHHDL